jgi:hypothetical protein
MNGSSGENYKQRINKIKEYVKFYKTIKEIFETKCNFSDEPNNKKSMGLLGIG